MEEECQALDPDFLNVYLSGAVFFCGNITLTKDVQGIEPWLCNIYMAGGRK
jgi:uncharacterized pyridoxamine 5'-phosphate oxidase family protein